MMLTLLTLAAQPPENDPILLAMKILIPIFVIGMFIYYGVRRKKGILVEPDLCEDENKIAEIFAKKDVIFASEKDLHGKLILTDKYLRYIGLDSHKCLLSVKPQQLISLTCKKHKINIEQFRIF